MNPIPPALTSPSWAQTITLLGRAVVGGYYVFMGLSKALEPVEFLKLARQYELVEAPPALNLIAAALPWFEVFCGLLLLGGIGVRGAALLSLAMLIPFTWAVWQRALAIQATAILPFCAVRFDCGCGAGEVLICRKLGENGLLIVLSTWLLFVRHPQWCLQYEAWPRRIQAPQP